MTLSRPLSAVLLCSALFAAGCATMSVGQRYAGASQDPELLDLCVFTPGSGFLDRNVADLVMRQAVGRPLAGLRASASAGQSFRNAAYVGGLDDGAGCDVMLKVVGRNLRSSMAPTELYSARTKKLLKRFDASVDDSNGGAVMAAAALRPGAGLYEQVMREAGRATRSQAIADAGSARIAPGEGAAISKDELRRLMAEAVRTAAKEEAPAASPAPSSDVDTPRYKNAEDPDRYAVVVGVEKYNGLPDASYAERDAKAVYDHLLALGYPARNIALVTGAAATRAALTKNLEAWLPQNVGENSTVFFYYSGHGAPDPAGGEAYLVSVDGDPQYLRETAYPVKRVYEKLAALKAKRVLVAMDACFSGAGGRSVLAKGTRPLVSKIDLGAVGGKVVSLTASASTQTSGALDEQSHGLFTYYLLKGLNGEARDPSGAVTARSLHSYLTPKVQDAAKRANRDQVPQLVAGDGDFRLR